MMHPLHGASALATTRDLRVAKASAGSVPILPSLRTLCLCRCPGITDVVALGQCASLRTLDLGECTGIADVAALGQCPSLHTLDLRARMRVRDVAALGQCASLHTLGLGRCEGITDVAALGQCASFKYFYIPNATQSWGEVGKTSGRREEEREGKRERGEGRGADCMTQTMRLSAVAARFDTTHDSQFQYVRT